MKTPPTPRFVSVSQVRPSPFRLRSGSTISSVTLEERALIAQTRWALEDGSARRWRLASEIGLDDLADALGVPADEVSAWERGQVVPESKDALAYGRDLALIIETRRELADGTARRRREATKIGLGEFAGTIGVSTAAASQWERRDDLGRPVRVPGAKHALSYGRELAALERKAA